MTFTQIIKATGRPIVFRLTKTEEKRCAELQAEGFKWEAEINSKNIIELRLVQKDGAVAIRRDIPTASKFLDTLKEAIRETAERNLGVKQ